MKDGGTGRRGEMNLSVQKASVAGNRFARRWRAAGGTDGEERRWGSFRASAIPGNANEPICSTSYGRRVKEQSVRGGIVRW